MIYKPDINGFHCPAEVVALYMQMAWLDLRHELWSVKMGCVVGRAALIGHWRRVATPEKFLLEVDSYAWGEELERAEWRCHLCLRKIEKPDEQFVWRNMDLICLDCAMGD